MKRNIIFFCLCLLGVFACSKIEPSAPIDNPDNPGRDTTVVDTTVRDTVVRDTLVEDTPIPTTGSHNYLVILVQTADVQFVIPDANQAFWDMLNKQGYSDYGGTGSVKDYFVDQSNGAYDPTFDVYGPVTVDMPMSGFTVGYGLTKIGAARLFSMACDLLDPQVDFSRYDSNHNGVIDNVFFYYAGYNSADGPDGAIWPHAGVVEYKDWSFDGVKFVDYACTSELKGAEGINMARIGNFCHEFAHFLGLPDLYDTQKSNDNRIGQSDGVGNFSLMHSGCYNNNGNTPPSLNPEERLLLGWLDSLETIPVPVVGFSVAPVRENHGYRTLTDNPGEYFCYEYRDGKGWDAYVPSGLVIYHVDKSQNDVDGKTAAVRWEYLYDLNGYAAHECMDLVRASDSCDVFGTSVLDFFPISWNGATQPYRLYDISLSSTDLTLSTE